MKGETNSAVAIPSSGTPSSTKPTVIPESVKALSSFYHFIGNTERFDESCFLLALQLNITMCDVLYLKAKDSHDDRKDSKNQLFVPHPGLANESITVQNYAKSEEFVGANQLDYALIQQVNILLDEKIHRLLGKDKYDIMYPVFAKYLKEATHTCYPKDNSNLSLKDVTECYWNDNGCGYKCLDQFCVDHPILLQKISTIDVNNL